MAALTEGKNFIIKIVEDFMRTDKGELNILGKMLKVLIIYLIMKFFIKMTQSFLDKTINTRIKNMPESQEKKYTTVGQVLKNVIRVLIYFIGIMTILDVFHINTNSIIATAGIGSLAIGFGAQSLVKDVITGSFILFEDQYSVGDHIEIKGYEGIVEELGLRLTKIRDLNGELHIIPNGEISIVTNKSRGSIRSMINFTIAYEEDIDHAIKVLDQMCKDIKVKNEDIEDGPDILGVNQLGDHGVEITIRIVSKPLAQYQNERDVKKAIKETLEKEGIEIPYSRLVILNKGEV